MRLVFALCAVSLLGQSGPPTFAPNDPEGLKSSRNPQVRYAWKRKVFWKTATAAIPGFRGNIPPYTPAESQQMGKTLTALLALFQATPAGSTGEGFWVNAPQRLGYQDPIVVPATLPAAKLPLTYEVGLFPFYHEDVESNGQWRLSVKNETESVYFHFNQLPVTLIKEVIAEEPRANGQPPTQLYLRPRVTAKFQGMPVYENQVLVVARAGRDPWAPAALGRVMKASLPLYEKDRQNAEDRLAGLKKKNEEIQSAAWEQQQRDDFEKKNAHLKNSNLSGNYATRLQSMERYLVYERERAAAEANPKRDDTGNWYWNPIDAHADFTRRLAALTPADAARPACFLPVRDSREGNGRYAMRGDVRPAGASPACRDVVTTNYDYFDLTLPRTAPQLLTIRDFGRCAKLDAAGQLMPLRVTHFDAPAHGCYRHVDMWRDLDWAKFATFVVP